MPAFYDCFTDANSLAALAEGHQGRGISVRRLRPLPPERPLAVEVPALKLGLHPTFMVLYISTADFDEPSGHVYLCGFQA